MARINLDVVKSKLESSVTESENIARSFTLINNGYIEGTKNVWSTPAAASYIDKVTNALNDYINQLNTKLQESINEFVNGVNQLNASQDIPDLSGFDLANIDQLSRSWQGEEVSFNVPEDYGGFTENNLSRSVESIKTALTNISSNAEVARDNGMAGAYCTNIVTNINGLINSANEVIASYNTESAKAAVEEDTKLSTIKSQT